MSHASYLDNVFIRKNQDKCIREIKKLIQNKNLEFDGFVVTGVSGIAMGAILSRVLKKELVIVRKYNDLSHSAYSVENYNFGKKYIFLDDLIASGDTYKRVRESISICSEKKWLYGYNKRNRSKIIGCIVYDGINKIAKGVQFVSVRKLNSLVKNK